MQNIFLYLPQVAARAGQACQIELLLVYGADPGAVDKGGKSASDYARESGHTGVAGRISNSCYELSDRLSFFLCQKKPNHVSGNHFLVPEIEQEKGKTKQKHSAPKRSYNFVIWPSKFFYSIRPKWSLAHRSSESDILTPALLL